MNGHETNNYFLKSLGAERVYMNGHETNDSGRKVVHIFLRDVIFQTEP